MQRSRRERFATHQGPATWEAPVAALLTLLVVAVAMPLVVQGLLGWATSGEFAWPSGRIPDAYRSLRHGHFGTGLRDRAGLGLPPDWVMWLLTIAGEVVALGAVVVGGMRLRQMTGGGCRHGLATPAQASQALGVIRLQANAAVIRPDLYAHPCRARRRPTASRLESTDQLKTTLESTARGLR